MRTDPQTPNAPRPARAVALLAVMAAGLFTSCRPNKRYDLIEAELRTRDRELAEARTALEASRNLNRAHDHSRPPEFPGAPPPVPAAGGAGVYIREISLGRGTGGVDDDGVPGDEALMVVIVPTDEDKSPVKVPGRVMVAAWEVTPQGLKTPIGSWDVTPEQLRPTWRTGLISTGYFVRLPWQTPPTANKVRVAVRLTTFDNRAFEADRDITVRPITGARPASREPGFPANPPGLPPPAGFEELPPPAGLGAPERGVRLLPPRS